MTLGFAADLGITINQVRPQPVSASILCVTFFLNIGYWSHLLIPILGMIFSEYLGMALGFAADLGIMINQVAP